jgi:hypothetical protein
VSTRCPDPTYVADILEGFRLGGTALDVLAERQRQDAKWGTSFPGRPHSHWLAIAAEELGEAAEDVCKTEIPSVVQRTTTLSHLRHEVIQLAAVALSWLEHGDWGSGRERSAE